ncbi:MAG TPA: PKD domain-containing protein, partial [Solirubrobacteraceae bacterium]|nr:PKD domain-containing protein [Solirubrobacteraceae bacterium]
ITDPVNGGGWWDNNSGNEDGDNCNAFGTLTPTNGTNPNAFLPTLGGSASAGTLFNQSINGNRYYIQSEWSNGDVNCEMQPSAGTVTAGFTVSGPQAAGNQLTFDPSASTSTMGYSSVTWQWGDGTPDTFSAGGPAITHHTFASPGVRLVTLTLVDTRGNLSTSSMDVEVGIPPTAAFTLVPASVMTGSPVSFDASGSTDPNAVAINSYQWSFGDGSSGAGATTTHSYAAPGSYTVTLTVTDSIGFSSAPVTRQVTVLGPPTPAFAASPANPGAGSIVSFDAGASSDPNHGGSVSSYSWSFGDGTAGASGVTTRHAYAAAGTYPVTLTVTDSLGLSASTVEQVVVDELPTARIGVKTAHPAARVAVAFDGSGSRDADGTIASYRWSFGDGSAPSSGAAPKHTYARAGTYRVVLTVTDGSGQTAAAASSLKVAVDSRIVKTALATTKKGRFLLVVVDGAGVVRAGSNRVTLRRAGTAKIRLVLSAAERRTLREKHRVAVTLTIAYAPAIGPAVSKRVSVVVRG